MTETFSTSPLPILTQEKHIRRWWIVLINASWFISLYTMFVLGAVLPFTLRRFTDDTRVIALVTSVGLWFGIVLGPIVNYTSDRIWTRLGRRRPFMMVAACGTLLATLCIPFAPALTPLILLVVVSSILGDVGSTLEPLWLEVVPPNQRGQAMSIRILAINMAALLFFQVMFAQMDHVYHLPGGWQLSGEQTCYLSAALLQMIWLACLAFLIREVKPEGVHLRRRGEIRSEQLIGYIKNTLGATRWWHYLLISPLPAPWLLRWSLRPGLAWLSLLLFPCAFLVRFFQDVFTDKRWWWVYLFYVAGTFVQPIGTFSNLMLVEQFHYSKPSIALTGLPVMILANAMVMPFMAWYADRLKRFNPWLLLGVMLGSSVAIIKLIGLWPNLAKVDLPPFWAMMVLAILTTLGSGAGIIFCFQLLRALRPQANPRVWAWVMYNAGLLLLAVVYLTTIKIFCGGVPSITTWFLLMCISQVVSCLPAISGPLLYDLIPKDKIGTLSSGFGLINTIIQAVLTTLAGSWIYFVSRWTSGGATTKDYTNIYSMQITLGFITVILMTVFAWRMFAGKIVEYGRLGLKSTDAVPAEPDLKLGKIAG